ncbi:MAG: Ig-like domain-containing protein [Spirochaetia bacterium]|nr:Ig-like domain-containing protein [Spirochaetia bacterium]
MLKNLSILLFIAATSACSPIQTEKKNTAEHDFPPVIQEVYSSTPDQILLTFDKEIKPSADSFMLVPETVITSITAEGNRLCIQPEESLSPGQEYFIKGTVTDTGSNSTTLGATFYGYNPDVPEVLVNEFTTNGSGKHPDLAELYVRTDGNMAGVTLYAGTKTTYGDKIIFPDLKVRAGDYIIIHFKPQGLETEIDEIHNKKESAGYDTSDTAWDFWVREGSGLSGNNGALTLYDNPYGKIIDAVIYTNRTSESDTNYRGFGSTKFMLQADEIADEGCWKFKGDQIAPEDCINSAESTATRSMGRNSSSDDTDSTDDWHTVPTSKFSFGKANSDEKY